MESKIFAALSLISVIALGIKLAITEVASIIDLWNRVRGKGSRHE